jgi:hypothetical protein
MDCAEVVDKLTRRFGTGTRKDLRLALYERLGRLCEEEGEEAVHVIATVADDASRAREPDKYFAWVVMRRLIERGLIQGPQL